MPLLAHHLAGRADGPTLALVHGFLSSRHQWTPNLGSLTDRARVVSIELPGHGDSHDPVAAGDLAPEVIISEIDRIRDELGIDRWVLLGQSLGGAIALRYALDHPAHTAAVAFTNTVAAFGVARGRGPGGSPIPPELRSVRDVAVHPIHARRLAPEVQAELVRHADRVGLATVRFVGANRDGWRIADRLGELVMPVLCLNGRYERRFQPCVELARSAVADLTVADLEGGHAINLDDVHGFDAALGEWLDQLPL